jgi:hypothetical protein
MAYMKPTPAYDNVNRKYWESAKEHKFVIQKCQDCGTMMFPPAGVCRNCLSENLAWVESNGRGKVWSFNVFHQLYWAAFKEEVPYNVVWVELEEGLMIISKMVGIKNEDIRVDMPVKVDFEDITEEWTLPVFRPAV